MRTPTLPVASVLERRSSRMLAHKVVQSHLLSVAGLVGAPALGPSGEIVGRVVDVVARWKGETYPPVVGLILRVGRGTSFLRMAKVESLEAHEVRLVSARVDLVGYVRRPGEVALAGDVIDRQLVDRDGLRVVRASDLYLTHIGDLALLVGVDVGLRTLVRRLGPRRWRARPTPERVIDWANITPFGVDGGAEGHVTLSRSQHQLQRLGPADLADLLEQLGRAERRELLGQLDPAAASDALEEMEPQPLRALLREMPTDEAAALVAGMAADEASEALRSLDPETTRELLAAMPIGAATRLRILLGHDEDSAGGTMTTDLMLAGPDERVSDVRDRLRGLADNREEIDHVVVVDDDGRALFDLPLFDLVVAAADQPIGRLIPRQDDDEDRRPLRAVTVDADLDEVIDALRGQRRSSVLVVDDDGRPLGRILADDVIDALVDGGQGRLRFPRLVE